MSGTDGAGATPIGTVREPLLSLRGLVKHFPLTSGLFGRQKGAIRALDGADIIFPVMQTTLPCIRDGKRLLAAFRSLDYAPQKQS